jgi:hypothetical protein
LSPSLALTKREMKPVSGVMRDSKRLRRRRERT